jgi:hypothetical protein
MTDETPSHRGDCAERTGVSDKEPGRSPLMTEDLLSRIKEALDALPAWARDVWDVDEDEVDAFSVCTPLDGDVDGDTGRHLTVGGELVADTAGEETVAAYIALLSPQNVRALIGEVERLTAERDEALRQLIEVRLNRPALDDLCRLSIMFGRSSDLRTDQDIRINEWMKAQIADARGEL